MLKKLLVVSVILSFLGSGCGMFNQAYRKVDKDIPIEGRDALKQKYEDREAWTRSLLVDDRENRIIDRDIKVELVALDLHWTGGITVKGPDKRLLRHQLNLERPLTREKVEKALARLFWFKDPDYRYRMNLRKYKSKKTARAIRNHELFKGMDREAALESWGYPDEIKESQVTAGTEQWIYRDPRKKGQKRYIYISENGKVDHWDD